MKPNAENLYAKAGACPLFAGISGQEFGKLLSCLSARVERHAKNGVLLLAGAPVREVGVVLVGSVQVLQEDAQGNTAILAELQPPDVFLEVFVCAGLAQSPVTVQAAEACEVLMVDFKRLLSSCSSACAFHTRLVENMLRLLAGKTLKLNQKLNILAKRSTREKLLAYFDAQREGEPRFHIPFNREELAQYLCVDRSAMSSELGRMQREGLIRFCKNQFEIL